MMKKVFTAFFAALCLINLSAEVQFSEYKLEAEILMKKSVPGNSLAFRNVLYAPVEVEEGSPLEFVVKASDVKKGYTGFELFQEGGASIKVLGNGKEQKIVPGKIFTKEGGTVWLRFTAPDKQKYNLPSDIRVVDPVTVPAFSETSEAEKVPVFSPEKKRFSWEEEYFIRDQSFYADNGNPECEFAGLVNQKPAKGSNEQVVVKNVPEGTKSRLFLLDKKEMLVFLAPDLSLDAGDNAYTLFYSLRRAGRDEEFSQPKRVIDNPKINGKLCNIADFTGCVTVSGGKKRVSLVWIQVTVQNTEETEFETLLENTAVSSVSWKDGEDKWSKIETVCSSKKSLIFNPVISSDLKDAVLRVTNSPNNSFYSEEENPAFAPKDYFYTLDKNGKWNEGGAGSFVDYAEKFQFTDSNSMIPEDYEYVFDKDGNVCGAVYSGRDTDISNGALNCMAKTYVKSPDTKKMFWTESVPVIYHNFAEDVIYPSAVVRPTGEWLLTYISTSEEGNNICVARVNYEPCLVTGTMEPDKKDMQKPGNTVNFTVSVRNLGLGIAEGCDVIIKNELKTEAGKVTTKHNIYPGTTYSLPSVYAKLKGKNGVVPVEDIKAEAKLLKALRNSEFATCNASFTLGIPEFRIGDLFVTSKGADQKVTYTLGTINGVRVKSPAVETIITEHCDSEDYEDNTVILPVNYDISDDYLELSYEYSHDDFEEESFDFDLLVHFDEKHKRGISDYSEEEIEERTKDRSVVAVVNPKYTRKNFSCILTGKSFVKKTRIMTAEIQISNNWPEKVEDNVTLGLVNLASGETEQSVEVSFTLDVLQNKKAVVSFEPAISENAADYAVMIIK